MSISSFIAEALLRSRAYPDKPEQIELIQTQMSFVFLTGKYVYKIKKPVDLGYLDYTTLERRRFFCRQEVELNRRLCPDVYLAAVPVTEENGELRVEGRGEPVEYAVKMKQLPRNRMMDLLLAQSQVTPQMVTAVARKLADFHSKAETSAQIASFGGLDVIRHNCDENLAQTEKYIGRTIASAQYALIKSYTYDFIESNASLFDKRVREDRIRDCHGDLHAAHICFTEDICIYDCIEFNDRFRFCDVASELAFLAMDLDHYQTPSLSQHLVSAYIELSHDEELLKLLPFYKCYRAYVRGKVESFKLDDPLISQLDKTEAARDAQSYFQLAESYV